MTAAASALSTTLYLGPSCFGLASLDLEAAAVESLLRLGEVSHKVVRSASALDPRVAAAAVRDGAAVAGARGVGAVPPAPVVFDASAVSAAPPFAADVDLPVWCATEAARRVVQLTRIDERLADSDRATTAAITALVRSRVFPALETLWLSHDGDAALVDAAVTAAAALPASAPTTAFIARWWAGAVRPFARVRAERLAHLRAAGRLRGADDAFEALEDGLAALERAVAAAATHAAAPSAAAARAGAAPRFVLGGAAPTSADAFVFAAASAVVFGQFADGSPLRAFQRQAVQFEPDVPATGVRLPALKQYAVAMAAYLAAADPATAPRRLELRPPRELTGDAADPYSDGRAEAIAAVAVALLGFAVAANWRALVALTF
jgi:hypothetical protein